ncbi:MAG: MlaD family protein, partial [Planctomycetota bacterium]
MNLGKNLLLGGFVLVTMAVLTYFTFRLSGVELKERARWVVFFGADSTIREGFEVFTAGQKVGRVESIALVPDAEIAEGRYVRAVLALDPAITLRQGARVALTLRGFLGERVCVLHRGDPRSPPLAPGTELPGVMETGVMEAASEVLRDGREELLSVLRNLDEITSRMSRGEGSFGRLLTEDRLYEDFARLASNLRELSDALNSEASTLGRLSRNPALARDVEAAAADLRAIVAD